jgi:hypothetical protein
MPDSPKAGHRDHRQAGAELRGDDAERKAGVLHAAFDHDRTPVRDRQARRKRADVAERKAEAVVQTIVASTATRIACCTA